ncbi:MAG: alpha/beta fold hydrolase [Chloroflexi bacterium]|nr:MAG: alpha/beta fold hydrolase [Chloroflexota bacterium]
MLTSFNLWRQWSDRALDATFDFWKRSIALNQLVWRERPAVAQTPADVVYTENKLRLLRYRATTDRQYPTPLLLVPSIINRYYILDLKPGRSLVEYLRDKGFDVWMIDWGTPGDEDRFVTFDYHIDGYLVNCVQEVLEATGQPQLSILGYCIGGVLTTVFTALYDQYVRNLINLAAPTNFHDDGLLSLWTRKENFPVDLLIDTYGNMPAWLLQTSFKWLRPTGDLGNAWTLWERLDQPERLDDFLTLNRWVEDNVSVPGETYRKFVRDCYQDNLLVQNRLQIGGRRVDLSAIRCPLLNVTASRDHIVPPQSAAVLNDLVSSEDKTLLQLRGGHIGVVAGSQASNVLWPQLADWLAQRSR